MGITKLMHMKEGKKRTFMHLKNGIEYILNEKKTENGIWIGGNSGVNADEVLRTFLDTKSRFGKNDGRQGYHFVISFKAGEVDAATCFDIVKDFCDQYLGDHFDHVFAIHNDKEHIHGHVIFNSVSRVDGLKYHYTKGDWDRIIQPITDSVSQKYGLEALKIKEQRVGTIDKEWSDREKGISKKIIVRADIDWCIERSNDWSDFVTQMQMLGYALNFGNSKRTNDIYVSFYHPALKKAIRSLSLGEGYDVSDIKERITIRKYLVTYERLDSLLRQRVPQNLYKMVSVHHKMQVGRRLYQAVNYYRLPNPYAMSQAQVRKDMLDLETLCAQCDYLLKQHLDEPGLLEDRLEMIELQIKHNAACRKTLYGLNKKYQEEHEKMNQNKEKIAFYNNLLKELRNERKMITGILATEHLAVGMNEKIEKEIIDHEKRIRIY